MTAQRHRLQSNVIRGRRARQWITDEMEATPMRLVRVVAPKFVAGFLTDGRVRVCAPILRKYLFGRTDDEARAIIARRGWKASLLLGPGVSEHMKGDALADFDRDGFECARDFE